MCESAYCPMSHTLYVHITLNINHNGPLPPTDKSPVPQLTVTIWKTSVKIGNMLIFKSIVVKSLDPNRFCMLIHYFLIYQDMNVEVRKYQKPNKSRFIFCINDIQEACLIKSGQAQSHARVIQPLTFCMCGLILPGISNISLTEVAYLYSQEPSWELFKDPALFDILQNSAKNQRSRVNRQKLTANTRNLLQNNTIISTQGIYF